MDRLTAHKLMKTTDTDFGNLFHAFATLHAKKPNAKSETVFRVTLQ